MPANSSMQDSSMPVFPTFFNRQLPAALIIVSFCSISFAVIALLSYLAVFDISLFSYLQNIDVIHFSLVFFVINLILLFVVSGRFDKVINMKRIILIVLMYALTIPIGGYSIGSYVKHFYVNNVSVFTKTDEIKNLNIIFLSNKYSAFYDSGRIIVIPNDNIMEIAIRKNKHP